MPTPMPICHGQLVSATLPAHVSALQHAPSGQAPEPEQLTKQACPPQLTFGRHAPSPSQSMSVTRAKLSMPAAHELVPRHAASQRAPPQRSGPLQLSVPEHVNSQLPAKKQSIVPAQARSPLHHTLQLSASPQSMPPRHASTEQSIWQGKPLGQITGSRHCPTSQRM